MEVRRFEIHLPTYYRYLLSKYEVGTIMFYIIKFFNIIDEFYYIPKCNKL